MTPLQLYQQQLTQGLLQTNPAQQEVIVYLNEIYQKLCALQKQRSSQFGKICYQIKPHVAVKGLYLWGSVGAGKTHLVNLFYQCLPTTKMRQHERYSPCRHGVKIQFRCP